VRTVIRHGRSSFPYLAVAREHGVAYTDVLLLSERLEEGGRPEGVIPPSSPAWAHATFAVWAEERDRRARCNTGPERQG
jgi:hypothetical protein